jgi:preprotein translocase subunit SecA
MLDNYLEQVSEKYISAESYAENWDWDGLRASLQRTLLIDLPVDSVELSTITPDILKEKLAEAAREAYRRKEKAITRPLMRRLERYAILKVIDENWRDHLYEMDQMKEGINLRAYGQKDPLLEYKSEGFKLFAEMLSQIDESVLTHVFRTTIEIQPRQAARRQPQRMQMTHQSATGMGFEGTQKPSETGGAPAEPGKPKPVKVEPKVGRNDPCPCGSGKKYKKCHGAQE